MVMDSRRSQMINSIQQIEFMLIELNLYLDTHPYDANAIQQFNHYSQQHVMLERQYEQIYGPMMLHGGYQSPTNRWRWVEEPWPWEKNVNRGAM